MAEISKSRFSIFKQTVAGNSGTNSNWQNLNVVLPGVSGGPANTVVESQRIDPDRNAPGVKLVGGASGLSIPFEAQVPTAATQAFWELLRASVYADSADAALTSANNTSWTGNTLLIAAGDDAAWDGGAVEVGDVLQVYSNAAPTVKYYARVTAITGDITDVQTDITSPTAAVDLRIKKGITVTNGSTQATFGMLRSFYAPGSVAYDLFNLYTQEVMEAVQMSITSQSLVTGTFQTTGVGSASIAATTNGLDPALGAAPTFTAAPTSDVLDGTNNVPFFRVAGADYPVQTISMGWQNNSQSRTQVGTYAATGISAGLFRGTGQLTAYFDDFAEFNKAIAGTASSAYVVMEDSSQRALIISFPRIRYGNPTLPGQDRDVIATLPFSFEKGTTELNSIRIAYIN